MLDGGTETKRSVWCKGEEEKKEKGGVKSERGRKCRDKRRGRGGAGGEEEGGTEPYDPLPAVTTTRPQLRVVSHLLSSSTTPHKVTRMKVHLPVAALLLLLRLSGESPAQTRQPSTASLTAHWLMTVRLWLLSRRRLSSKHSQRHRSRHVHRCGRRRGFLVRRENPVSVFDVNLRKQTAPLSCIWFANSFRSLL